MEEITKFIVAIDGKPVECNTLTRLKKGEGSQRGDDFLVSVTGIGDVIATVCDDEEINSGKVMIVWGRELVDENLRTRFPTDVLDKLSFELEGACLPILD